MTVPSIEAMLEPRMVAASTQFPARGARHAGLRLDRMAHSSAACGMTDAAPVMVAPPSAQVAPVCCYQGYVKVVR